MKRIVKITFMVMALQSFSPFVGRLSAQPLGILSAPAQGEPQKALLSSPNGRFVFGQVSDSSKDQFMLDTLSGRLWRITESGKMGLYMKSVPYCTEEGKCTPYPGDDKLLHPSKSE